MLLREFSTSLLVLTPSYPFFSPPELFQFSGSIGDQMVDCYGMFCSHHLEADRIYKDLIQNNKRLQALDRVRNPHSLFASSRNDFLQVLAEEQEQIPFVYP